METSFCFLLFQLFHLFQPAQRCLLHCPSPLHSSRYVSRIKRRGMKLTCRATREREKERGWLLNVQATTRSGIPSLEGNGLVRWNGMRWQHQRSFSSATRNPTKRGGGEGRRGFSRRHLRGAVSFPRVSHMLTSLGFSGRPRGEIRATVH